VAGEEETPAVTVARKPARVSTIVIYIIIIKVIFFLVSLGAFLNDFFAPRGFY
jgi:hypothetical protein